MEKIGGQKFYQKLWFSIVMLIFICPVGVFLIWKNKLFNNVLRVLFTIIAIPYSLIGFFFWIGMSLSDSESKNKNTQSVSISNSVAKDDSLNQKNSDDNKENVSIDEKNKNVKSINDYVLGEPEFLELYLKQNNIKKINFSEEKKLSEIENKIKDIDLNSKEFKYLNADNTKKNEIKGKFNEYKITNDKTNVMYIGELKNNRPNGIGAIVELIQYEDGKLLSKKYVGNFKNGYFNGYGKLYDVPLQDDYGSLGRLQRTYNFKDLNYVNKRLNGLRYEGNFDNGTILGQGNEFVYLDPELEVCYKEKLDVDVKSQSDIYAESREGKEINQSELDTLNFEIEDGFKVLNNPMEIFCGDYDNGELNGKCRAYKLGKLYYDGEFKNNQRDGKGIVYFENSDSIKYKGEFKDGKADGKGTLYDKEGNIIYSGKFKNGDYQ